MNQNKVNYTITGRVEETHDTVTLVLKPSDGTQPPAHTPGQYVTVFIDELNTPEGKAYSIASPSPYNEIHLTIKKMGPFSTWLCERSLGDQVTLSDPYGFFYSEENNPLVLVAGGIGITPFMSMIRSHIEKPSHHSFTLLLSNKTTSDIPYRDELSDTLMLNEKNIYIHHFITRETSDYYSKRINAEKILDLTQHLDDPEYMLCGSIPFVRDIWKDLKQACISESNIYTESFF